jgi:hypothetical protein
MRLRRTIMALTVLGSRPRLLSSALNRASLFFQISPRFF